MDRLPLGVVTVTAAATAALARAGSTADRLLERFRAADWGTDDADARSVCDFCLANGLPLISWYTLTDGTRLALASAADRGETLLALAAEHGPVEVSCQQGYADWSKTYDTELNQLIPVEQVCVDQLLAGDTFHSVLDAATGTGRHALALASRSAAVTAFDSCPEMMAIARARATAEGLPIGFVNASLSGPLPFADGCFDLVICGLVFCHLPDIAMPCREFRRVTRPGGRLVLTDFHPDALDSGWRTDSWSGLNVNRLPNFAHHRAGYIEAVERAGFSIRSIHEIRIADIPAEINYSGLVKRWGAMNFCIVVDAEKR